MSSAISIILGIIKIFPIVDRWIKGIVLLYTEYKLKAHDDAFARASIALIKDHSQILLEEAMGSSTAGKPSPDQSEIVTRPVGPH